jgi:NAD(P)-dependent dehydrogenase (short-subunit alcohol dehydrogenase family)
VDPREMELVFAGKRIMVTGAGGSIGTELCRQLARFSQAAWSCSNGTTRTSSAQRGLALEHPQLQ